MTIERSDFKASESNLCKHARRELELAGVDDEMTSDLLSVVEAFARLRPSGSQAQWYIITLVKLLQFENLMSLTDDPNEWTNVSEKMPGTWQSVRNPEAFSKDGGKTYYLLSEVPSGNGDAPVHTTVHKGPRMVNR